MYDAEGGKVYTQGNYDDNGYWYNMYGGGAFVDIMDWTYARPADDPYYGYLYATTYYGSPSYLYKPAKGAGG